MTDNHQSLDTTGEPAGSGRLAPSRPSQQLQRPTSAEVSSIRLVIAVALTILLIATGAWLVSSGSLFTSVLPQLPTFSCAPPTAAQLGAVNLAMGIDAVPSDVSVRSEAGMDLAAVRSGDTVGVFELRSIDGALVAIPADNTAELLSGSVRDSVLPATDGQVGAATRQCLLG